jgi:TonB-dependent receptor
MGLQVVQASQASEGWEYRGDGDHPDINLLFKRTGGTSYTDYLPSLNLAANLQRDLIMRFGLAKVLARPSIIDMRAGTSTPGISDAQAGTPLAGQWNMAYAGNPEIEPWRATSIDLSFEKYFGKRSYVSAALFRKNLQNYIFNEVSARDNSFLPRPASTPVGVTPLQYGPVTKPTNGHGGSLSGVELSASLEGGLVHPVLDGFGVVASASKLTSDLKDANGEQIMLNGLSGTSASVTFYYENRGFSARVSERYRAPFTATSRDIYFKSVTLQQEADRVVDLQFGYAIEHGAYKGLSFLFQVNNVLDQVTMNSKTAGPVAPDNTPDTKQLIPNFTYSFGRQTLVGLNYKF